MAHLSKALTALGLGVLLWLSRQTTFRASGLGMLAVIGVIAWVTYTLTRGLRWACKSATELRELPVRRDALWLVLGNGAVGLGLLGESQRLSDPFWWRCALLPAGIAVALGLRLLVTRPLYRSPWAGRGHLERPASSWPHISVTATATHAPSVSGGGSVSMGF